MLLSVLMIFSTTIFSQVQKTDSIYVYGNCGMCKNRIEKTVKQEGVSNAEWNSGSKILVVTYDTAMISNDDLQKKIAAAGHDTEKYQAEDKVYEKLPGCCHYQRKGEGKKD